MNSSSKRDSTIVVEDSDASDIVYESDLDSFEKSEIRNGTSTRTYSDVIESTFISSEDDDETNISSGNSTKNVDNQNFNSTLDIRDMNHTSKKLSDSFHQRQSSPSKESDDDEGGLSGIIAIENSDLSDIDTFEMSEIRNSKKLSDSFHQRQRSPSKESDDDEGGPTVISDDESEEFQPDSPIQSNMITVSKQQYEEQRQKVADAEVKLFQVKNSLKVIKLDALVDKGKLLLEKHQSLIDLVKMENEKFKRMNKDEGPSEIGNLLPSWADIKAGANDVQPRTFGKVGMAKYSAQKALTLDRLEQMHSSLETCPSENQLCDDPKGLKVELMPHQKRALTWLRWREKQKPSGGILADDMGLGKTLTMISVILNANQSNDGDATSSNDEDSDSENQPERKKHNYFGGTLVVCPASLINQWSDEISSKCKRGMLSVELYHGSKREFKPKRLADFDVVITTYSIILNEYNKNGAVFRVRFKRIILDEAHQVRNFKSVTSQAVCHLSGKSRWALTGTPIHNKELDMYALLKFLRCSPFDDIQVWKRWVGDKSVGGQERLHTVISSLMLRRTKVELMEKGSLQTMPERKWDLITITLDKNEMGVYHKILVFSRTLFAQFLHQRAERNQDRVDVQLKDDLSKPNLEYFKMRQKLLHLNKVKEVRQHDILVLLLRLRQICCHPFLITQMLEGCEDLGTDEKVDDLNLLDQLQKLSVNDDVETETVNNVASGSSESVGLKEASKGYLNPSNPVFSRCHMSSKIKKVLELLKEKILPTNDKAIVVSQWRGYLELVADNLRKEKICFEQLDGSVPVPKRMPIVNNINNPKSKTRVLLLSLTAGGVGLNLVGANHLFLLDLHWNPQLESQAQDRIYRMGQDKPVFIYKFLAADTIEQRIQQLQENKLAMAESLLTGSKQISNKLSLQDLKMLFEFNSA